MTNSKPVAKSLHTITAIQQVARFVIATQVVGTYDSAIDRAMDILGLAGGRDDPYSLRAAALKALISSEKK